MPHYHFDFRDGEIFDKDEEGRELPDIESAQNEAAQFLADMVKDLHLRDPKLPLGHPMSIEVRDGEGPVFTLSFALRDR